MTEHDKKRQREQRITLLLFILLAIFLHIAVGSFFYFLSKRETAKNLMFPPPPQVVWVKPELPPPTEIADIEKPAVEKRPEKARFGGQYDSSVKEERVARPRPKPKVIKENPLSGEAPPKKVARRMTAQPATPPETPAPTPEKIPPSKEEAKKEAVKEEPKEAMKEELPEIPKPEAQKPPSQDLALKPRDVLKESTPQKELPKPKAAPLDLRSVGPGLEFGRPSAPDLFMHDYYPDYKIGGKTYLNVMKLQDLGYFARMKRILKMRWNPVPSIRDYAMSNRLTMGKIECVVGVALDDSGRIAELIVIRSSGMGSYDHEAMQTLRDSSPYSRPPDQYMKDGLLRMSWTFTVYL